MNSPIKPKSKHPNLLFVFPDQMRGSAMGFLNEEPVKTPNLDMFSTQSLVLDNAASNFPVCSPYRAMLMSGKYPYSNSVITNCTSEHGVELREDEICWSDILKKRGYSMGYVGKWHLDAPHAPYINTYNNDGEVKWNEWTPPEKRHGFDYWYSYGTYDAHLRPMYWKTHAAREDFQYIDEWGPIHEADKAIAYLNNEDGNLRNPENPFCLVLSMNPPHMPYEQVPDKYKKQYKDLPLDECIRPNVPPAGTKWGDYYRKHIRNQYAMITGVDEQFGRILTALKENGLDENTIVIFTSDHGDCLGAHDKISKSNHYEESMHIPFMIRFPDVITPRRDDLLISAPDVYPTMMSLMGFADDIPEDLEGSNLAEIFTSNTGERPSSQLFLVPLNNQRGLRTERYTFLVERDDEGHETYELYDRKTDLYQLKNIAEGNTELIKELRAEMNDWLRVTKDPFLQEQALPAD